MTCFVVPKMASKKLARRDGPGGEMIRFSEEKVYEFKNLDTADLADEHRELNVFATRKEAEANLVTVQSKPKVKIQKNPRRVADWKLGLVPKQVGADGPVWAAGKEGVPLPQYAEFAKKKKAREEERAKAAALAAKAAESKGRVSFGKE